MTTRGCDLVSARPGSSYRDAESAGRHWPRNLLTPFLDDTVLTPADRASYRSYADTERHQPTEQLQATHNSQPSSHPKP